MENTATITICVWKLKLLRMETLIIIHQYILSTFQQGLVVRIYISSC